MGNCTLTQLFSWMQRCADHSVAPRFVKGARVGFDLKAIAVRLESEPIRKLFSYAENFERTICFPPFTNQTWGEPFPSSTVACAPWSRDHRRRDDPGWCSSRTARPG